LRDPDGEADDAPDEQERPVRPVSACFGGGGFFAIALSMGVADGLEDAGVPVRQGPMLGTSGGAWAAGALAAGVSMEHIVEVTARAGPDVPHRDMTHRVFGDRRDRRVRTVAIDLRNGRRQVLRGDRVGLADAVGASSAAPPMFPPYRIGRSRFVDGGLYSSTSAQLAASSRLLVLVAPMAGPMLRPVTTGFAQLARQEARLWRLRSRGRVLYVEPTRALLEAAGTGWRRILDPATTGNVYRQARELGRERGARFLERHPGAFAETPGETFPLSQAAA
jgi:predicted acylesterase/phospholipase RssA